MAEFTPRSAHTKVASVADVVAPYDFERQTVEGADVGAVWTAFGSYLEKARSGTGPFLLECSTHRRSGHYEGDQQSYRDALADAEWAQLDPIARAGGAGQGAGLDRRGGRPGPDRRGRRRGR